jgi:type VI secretion system protein ImpH
VGFHDWAQDTTMNTTEINRLFEKLHNLKKNRVTDRHHDSKLPAGNYTLKHHYSFAYPSAAFKQNNDHNDILVNALGILDHTGIIPHHYYESTMTLNHNQNHALGDFFNLFLPRLIELYYTGWLKNRPTRRHNEQENPYYYKVITSLVGLAPKKRDQDKHLFDDIAFSNLYTAATRNKANLTKIITLFTHKKTSIEENSGQWIELNQSDCSTLGGNKIKKALGGLNMRIGSKIWDRQQHIRIHIGPIRLNELSEYTDNNQYSSKLHELIRTYLPQPLTYEISITIHKDDIKPIQMGETNKAKLGLHTWLCTQGTTQHRTNITLGEPHGPS